MKNLAKGSCNCGNVSFEIQVELTDVYLCHCTICRKSTGSSAIAVTVVKNENFQWLSGESFIKCWQKPNHDWQTSFCTECGSPLPGKNDEKTTYIPVSLLDTGNEKLSVKHQMFTDSKASWVAISEHGTIHQNEFSTKKA